MHQCLQTADMHIFVLQISEAMVNHLPACANDDSAWTAGWEDRPMGGSMGRQFNFKILHVYVVKLHALHWSL